jgi:phenylpropionate dioxygenase-like ring-hydroxylating dioxygenase large terminal subunit
VNGSVDYEGLVKSDRIHGRVYTDPAIFDAEMATIFERGWAFVGHESEVPQPDDFRTTNIGRHPLIMARDRDGAVHVVFNRCTHRAATICQADDGNAAFFRCAYHGWTFRNSGQLVGVPYPKGYGSDFDKSEFDLAKPPRVDSYRGFVFASMSPDGPSLDDHLGPLVKAQIDLFMDLSPTGEIECTAGVNRFTYKGNWKFQLENTADFYHVNMLHRSLLDVLEEMRGMRIDDMSDENSPARNVSLGGGHTMMDIGPYNASKRNFVRDSVLRGAGPQADYVESLEEAYGPERTEELMIAGGTHLAVWPNLGVLAGMIRRIRPIAVDRTEVILTPALLKGVPDDVNAARLRGHEAFFPPAGMGGSDDQEIFERMQVGLQASHDPWLFIGRGMHREVVQPDGSVTAQVTDELNTRAIFRQWRDVMSGASTVASPREALVGEAAR